MLHPVFGLNTNRLGKSRKIQVQLVQAATDAMDPRNFLGERFTKEIYSSDFALQYALAARGWTIMPWEEAAQMHDNKELLG